MPRLRNSALRSKASARLISPIQKSFFRFGRDPRGFDILPGISGVVFEEAWGRRVEAVIDAATGLTAYFISADDLIAAKLASGRLQDLADAEAVQKAQRLKNADLVENDS